jgi:hypothetical protein
MPQATRWSARTAFNSRSRIAAFCQLPTNRNEIGLRNRQMGAPDACLRSKVPSTGHAQNSSRGAMMTTMTCSLGLLHWGFRRWPFVLCLPFVSCLPFEAEWPLQGTRSTASASGTAGTGWPAGLQAGRETDAADFTSQGRLRNDRRAELGSRKETRSVSGTGPCREER